MITPLPYARLPRFASLRSKLFIAFAGVLLLSLVLTATTFWVQIRVYDTQQVQSELQSAAPNVYPGIKHDLVRYWENAHPNPTQLKVDLTIRAHTFGVRIVLTDYCNHIAIDTDSTQPLSSPVNGQSIAACGQWLDDLTSADAQPDTLIVGLGVNRGQQVTLPGSGASFYFAYPAPPYVPYAPLQGTTTPLLVRTIIIAKSPGSVDQDALGKVLPRLALAGAFAVLLTLLVVVVIVGAITRPLRTIMVASERMARGDYDQSVPSAGKDEVGQLARSFNRMSTEVRDAREFQRQFIANVSHDLKTPLTSILGFSQILIESDEVTANPMQLRAAQVINQEARRLQRLTLDLLDLSRLEARQLQLRSTRCNLNELVGAALARYVDLPANKAIHFLDRRARQEVLVRADPDRLMQVLVNLLDNAVKFCDPGGSVAAETALLGAEAKVTISNTGVAIAQEDLARVFQRFYRTDHSRATRTGGTGLGLAIVSEIVAAHAGRVHASSDPDGWTRFVVTLPVAQANSEQSV